MIDKLQKTFSPDDTLYAKDMNLVTGKIDEIVESVNSGSGVGKVDPNSKGGTGEIFNYYENNKATGDYSHAEGSNTTASGYGSHAEGFETTASNDSSHAEGENTTASGEGSHSEGIYTIANNASEHAQGNYNKSNAGSTEDLKTIHSIGVGTKEKRMNAQEVMRNGDHYVLGIGGYDGTNPESAQTLQEVIKGITDEMGEIDSLLDQINGEVV